MKFGSLNRGRTPPGEITLAPSAFAYDWAKRANMLHPDFGNEQVQAFNDASMELLAARVLCNPEDCTEPYFHVEEQVTQALTPEATQAVYDVYDRLRVERSPVEPEATNEELSELAALAIRVLPSMPHYASARIRRLLGYCFLELSRSDVDATL